MEHQPHDFDFSEHERQLAVRYAELAKYAAFDALVDMALDGQISLKEAKQAWESGDEPTEPA